MRQAAHLFESIFSFAVFAVVTMAIAGTTYQLFNPDGGLIQWVSGVWRTNPTMLIMLGGVVLLIKRWLSGIQGSEAADFMFYGAILLGLYYGFNLLIAA